MPRIQRNPIKQIVSEVHRDARAGKLDLGGHGGFIAEVKRRARAAGLADEDLHEFVSEKEHRSAEQSSKARPAKAEHAPSAKTPPGSAPGAACSVPRS